MKKLNGSVLILALMVAPLALVGTPGESNSFVYQNKIYLFAAPQGEPQGRVVVSATRGWAEREGPEFGMWWKNSEVVQKLGMSKEQVNQIEQIFYQHRLKLIDLHADVEKQEAMLQPLIEADQPDEAKVSAQLDQLLAARGRLEKANTMMMLSIRRTLSVEQWKKLQALQQEREMHWRMERGAQEKAERQERERREREMQERMRKERQPAPAPRPPDGPPPASTPRPPDVPLF